MSRVQRAVMLASTLILTFSIVIVMGGWNVLAAVPADSSGTTKISLTIRELNQSDPQRISISARLTDTERPIGNLDVEFDVAANFFGEQQVNIGRAKTDATGTATIIYQPSWEGTQVITAHYTGNEKYPQVQVTKTITVSGPVAQYSSEPVGLLAVRQWITPLVGAGVIIFWALLIFVAVRTLRGISRSGKHPIEVSHYDFHRKPDIHHRKYRDTVYQNRNSGD
jgi:hypothetical protein